MTNNATPALRKAGGMPVFYAYDLPMGPALLFPLRLEMLGVRR